MGFFVFKENCILYPKTFAFEKSFRLSRKFCGVVVYS